MNPGGYTPAQIRLYVAAAIRSDLATRRAFVADARAAAAAEKLDDYVSRLHLPNDATDQPEE